MSDNLETFQPGSVGAAMPESAIDGLEPDDYAFPSKDDKYFRYGMTIREYAATKIMAGLATGLAMSSSWGSHVSNARDAVAAADALIAELNKPAVPPVKGDSHGS